MVRKFGFDVNAVEDNTGMNALAAAVTKRNLTLIEYLVIIITTGKVINLVKTNSKLIENQLRTNKLKNH